MNVPRIKNGQSLIEYAEQLAEVYCIEVDNTKRKAAGQFFTPVKVGDFMAGLFKINKDKIHLLDPGAGTGILLTAFCERIRVAQKTSELTIDAYENDPKLMPYLKAVLNAAKKVLNEVGITFNYQVYQSDFVLDNAARFSGMESLWSNANTSVYDFVISNPPYYKLSKKSSHAVAMAECVCGQPNIYTFFMALSASMLKPGGDLVFITPRSFCSGLYYKKFRKWFLNNMQIRHIHIFESRKQIFDKDDVLQENIILKAAKRKGKMQDSVIITTSKNKIFDDFRKIRVSASHIIDDRNGETFIRIPTAKGDVSILEMLDKWPATLYKMGLEVSTGPVVPFRATQHLLGEFTGDKSSAPLIWMHNMQGIRIVWPGNNGKKAKAVKISDSSRSLLIHNRNYVLLRRFSSKEQKRRLHASVLLESDLPTDVVGLENHVNYIHRPGGILSQEESFGIAAILNTAIADNYFRSLNGNTQVNATEIRSMPFPDMKDVRKIGRILHKQIISGGEFDFDLTVMEVVGIEKVLISVVNKSEEANEQS